MKCHGNHSLFYKTRKETRKLQNITKLNTPCPMFYEQIGLLVTRKAQNGCKWSSSVQFICSVMSNSLGPHGLQHARLPCPSPTPRAYSNSCPSSQWCHPAISSSVIHFSSRLQPLPASGSFSMNQFVTSPGQSIGVSALASVLLMNIQDLFHLVWIGWISLSKGLSRVLSNTTVQKHHFFRIKFSLWSKSHIHTWLLEKS